MTSWPTPLILICTENVPSYVFVYNQKTPIPCAGFKGGVNPKLFEISSAIIFKLFTVMYVKVYISGMEMSQRIHF